MKEGDDIVQDDGEDVNLDEALEESLHMEGEAPILDMGDSLVNMVDRLPAYKPNRGVAQGAVKEFTGFMCELCHRSFQDKNNADAHLKTKRHYYRFIEHIKERFDKEEKKKKADKEAEKTKTVEPVEDKQENGAKGWSLSTPQQVQVTAGFQTKSSLLTFLNLAKLKREQFEAVLLRNFNSAIEIPGHVTISLNLNTKIYLTNSSRTG